MKRLKPVLSACLVAIGLLMASGPALMNLFSTQKAAGDIELVREQAAAVEDGTLQEMLAQAERWNAGLLGQASLNGQEDLWPYEQQLQVLDDGIMGILSIPRLDLRLPVYHGTGEEALSKGAGHLVSSSLPIGSASGRAVVSAHRGLMQAELFTRLDEMEEGDLFVMETAGMTLAYRVHEIEVIRPDEVEALAIEPGRDLMTLMTCTPYGINDHRLLVHGERTEWNETVKAESEEQYEAPKMSLREMLFRLWPLALAILVGAVSLRAVLKNRKRV